MIKRNENMTVSVKVKMRDGNGHATIKEILNKDEYKGASRLVATITLEPGCSIGSHVHENEEEIFYIIQGTATYDDNGTTETLNVGDSCICLSGEKHSIANLEKEGNLVVFAVILTY